jgi:hypothetical protein
VAGAARPRPTDKGAAMTGRRATSLLVVLFAALILVALLTACASTTATTSTAAPSGLSAATTSGSASGDPGPTTTVTQSIEAAIAQMTSYEDLKALFKEAIAGKRPREAYLAGMRYIEIAPDTDEGYLWAVTGLLEMSKANYEEINGLLETAFSSVKYRERLVQSITESEPTLAISWPVVSDTENAADLNTSGTTCGNMSAGGQVAIQGKWAYFGAQGDGGKLYKIELTMPSDRQKICDDIARFINVIGDTIYYRNDSDGGTLYSIRTDGAERKKLGEAACSSVSVENGWIYFSTQEGEKAAFYRMRTDGSDPYVSGDWVYYVNKEDQGSLWRVPAGGGEPQKVVAGVEIEYAIADGKLYYLGTGQKGMAVFAAELDGSSAKEVYSVEGKISTFNVFAGTLFVSVRPQSTNKDAIDLVDIASQKVVKTLDAYTEALYCGNRALVYVDGLDANMCYRVDLNNWNITKIDP